MNEAIRCNVHNFLVSKISRKTIDDVFENRLQLHTERAKIRNINIHLMTFYYHSLRWHSRRLIFFSKWRTQITIRLILKLTTEHVHNFETIQSRITKNIPNPRKPSAIIHKRPKTIIRTDQRIIEIRKIANLSKWRNGMHHFIKRPTLLCIAYLNYQHRMQRCQVSRFLAINNFESELVLFVCVCVVQFSARRIENLHIFRENSGKNRVRVASSELGFFRCEKLKPSKGTIFKICYYYILCIQCTNCDKFVVSHLWELIRWRIWVFSWRAESRNDLFIEWQFYNLRGTFNIMEI